MKSAITNVGREFVANNTTGGAWFSITHFSLALVNDTERLDNPPADTATDLIIPQISGENNGDYIFNIWQTPFISDASGGKFGLGDSLPEGFGYYFKYEYDFCDNRNTLSVYNSGMEGLPSGIGINGTTYYGAQEGTSSGAYSGGSSSQLTLANIPSPLAYNTTTSSQFNTTTCTKYFPIKAFRVAETTDDTVNAKVSLMDYVLELPAVTSNTSNTDYNIENGIGNFKFNRIGLYVTKSTYPDPIEQLITSLVPVADVEPVLFAIIDLSSDELCGGEVLNIFKTRDDTGLSAFSFDAQVSLTTVNSYEAWTSAISLYRDSARDDATNHYINQLESTANTVEAIMQLQMQVIQLSQYLSNISGLSPVLNNKRGFKTITTLQQDNEYFIENEQNNIYYFKGDYFRSFDPSIVNKSNAIINIKYSTSKKVIPDGDILKIIIDNLDGRTYESNTTIYPYWSGNIYLTNYTGSIKQQIAKIDYTTLLGYSNAKLAVELTYCSQNSVWIVSSLNVINETALY